MRRVLRRDPRKIRGAFRPILGLVLVLSVLGVGLILWAVLDQFPSVEILRTHYPHVQYRGPKEPPKVELRRTRPAGWVPLNEISKEAVGAVLVSEDWAFFSHPGYDLNQIKEAMQHDLEKGSFARGASTITQQVVRNVFLTKEKSLWRKVRELVLAVRLDRKLGKRKTLEVYFNIAEWGPGVFGITAAAKTYFGKPPSQISAREGAFLAMLLPSPKRYSQSFRDRRLTAYAGKTIESILWKMERASMITSEARESARVERMAFEAREPDPKVEEDPELEDDSSEN